MTLDSQNPRLMPNISFPGHAGGKYGQSYQWLSRKPWKQCIKRDSASENHHSLRRHRRYNTTSLSTIRGNIVSLSCFVFLPLLISLGFLVHYFSSGSIRNNLIVIPTPMWCYFAITIGMPLPTCKPDICGSPAWLELKARERAFIYCQHANQTCVWAQHE